MMVHLTESQVKEIADLSFACSQAERAAGLNYYGSSWPRWLSVREMGEWLELVDPEPERKLISAVTRLADEALVDLQALIWFGRGDHDWQGCLDKAQNFPGWERSGCVQYILSKRLKRDLTAALKKLDRRAHGARKVTNTAEDSV
jgi:hypothetical protein